MSALGTGSLAHFVVERNRLLGLIDLVISKVLADFHEDWAQLTGNVPPERQRPLPSTEELQEYKAKRSRYEDYVALAHELTYCRIADSFLRYIAALLTEILTADPSLRVKSPGDTSTDVSEQVEAEVRSLTGGVYSFAGATKHRYGLKLFSSKAERVEIERIIEMRHVFTHNHGILDHRALRKLGKPPSEFGQRLAVTSRDLGRALGVVSRCAEGLDTGAVKRFRLSTCVVPDLRRSA